MRAGQRFSQFTMDLRELIVHHNECHISLLQHRMYLGRWLCALSQIYKKKLEF